MKTLARNACFHGYKFLFVAIDKWFNPSADNAFVSQANRWVFMNYQWLDKAAYRARLQSENHHAAVQLLLSYCQKQTDWQSPVEQKSPNFPLRWQSAMRRWWNTFTNKEISRLSSGAPAHLPV